MGRGLPHSDVSLGTFDLEVSEGRKQARWKLGTLLVQQAA